MELSNGDLAMLTCCEQCHHRHKLYIDCSVAIAVERDHSMLYEREHMWDGIIMIAELKDDAMRRLEAKLAWNS